MLLAQLITYALALWKVHGLVKAPFPHSAFRLLTIKTLVLKLASRPFGGSKNARSGTPGDPPSDNSEASPQPPLSGQSEARLL
jgi:hypothetical protein